MEPTFKKRAVSSSFSAQTIDKNSDDFSDDDDTFDTIAEDKKPTASWRPSEGVNYSQDVFLSPERRRVSFSKDLDQTFTSSKKFETPRKVPIFSDRMISSSSGKSLKIDYQIMIHEPMSSPKRKQAPVTRTDSPSEYFNALKNEVLPSTPRTAPAAFGDLEKTKRRLFTYTNVSSNPKSHQNTESLFDTPTHSKFGNDLLKMKTQLSLQKDRSKPRLISACPWKVLDAPELQDDFYLNLMDWSSKNILAVGLNACVYLWNAHTAKVSKLCNLSPHDSVTSITWLPSGSEVAVGTHKGLVQLWDVQSEKRIREFTGHTQRVAAMASYGALLSTGSRDRSILHRDIRSPSDCIEQTTGHKQEVCGLKWSLDGKCLASGGNDNKLMLWSKNQMKEPMLKFDDHLAAVKAIAWSPHQSGLLASGGGTADRHIRFWNTTTGTSVKALDTGSQVCNLAWSKSSESLVSTHGYSQNQIVVWNYRDMRPMATLTGHTTRVLYLAMSPSGEDIVTGAGDETLRFWNVFDRVKTISSTGKLSLPVPRVR